MTMISTTQNTIAILCAGGPAPGINSVISSITVAARKHGWEVIGIYDGFSWLAKGEKNVVPLTVDMVSRIYLDGGSTLRMSRFNPTKNEVHLRNVINTLSGLGVSHLVTIGGDDTAYSAYRLAEYAETQMGLVLHVVHVPKTIDNDLPLPEGVPTFGFETARSLGARIVANLAEDAKTTGRWFFITAMGRTAGHLALGMGKSAGATIIVIPEEFSTPTIRLRHLVDILCGAIIKRLAAGRGHGVAVIAEGLIEKIDKVDFEDLTGVERDEHGHIRYSEIDFSDVVRRAVLKELGRLGITMTIVDKEIGYEVRCEQPNAFDIEYTRNLGFGAFDFLRNGGSDAMITVQNNQIVPLPFNEILDSRTGKTQVRMVNVNSIQYRIAREYMIRLEADDFLSPVNLAKLAAICNLAPEEFRHRFEYMTLTGE
ncbi:MAG TPA: diphosphate--fructose-6-phosphate 1-phosphotransferase [Patescibacteria group bacterium]|nr:diphosphate--fructose-6-phosphate 1-phosphotransferase [Patescibacteria group bacterium]